MPEKNSAAVVTGGSSGIGKAVIQKIGEKFKTCFNLDIIRSDEEKAEFIETDISKIEEVNKAVEEIAQQEVQLNAIVLCAGIGVHEKISEGDPVKWKKVINTNLLGPLNVVRAFIPFLSEGGDIIFISSVAAEQPYEYGGIYVATKTALNVVAETLRQEVKGKYRISIVEPGLVETNFFKNTISGDRSNEDFPFDGLDPLFVATSVKYILDQPREVEVNKLIIRPSGQTF